MKKIDKVKGDSFLASKIKKIEDFVYLKEFTPVKFEQPPILVQGLPGMGLVGKIAAEHLITEFSGTLMARIYSSFLSPVVQLSEENLPKLACLELYAVTNLSPPLIVFTGDFQPADLGLVQVILGVLNYLSKYNFEEVLALGGVRLESKHLVFAVTYDVLTLNFLKEKKVALLKEGDISGAVAVLSALAAEQGYKSIVLLGQITQPGIDPVAAQNVLAVFEELYQFDLKKEKLKTLIEEAVIENKLLLGEDTSESKEKSPEFHI